MTEPAKVFDEALALPASQRARLAATLIDSLDASHDADVDEAWRVEVARRVRELEDGTVEGLDWLEARRRILG